MKRGRSASGFQPTDRHGLHQARRPSGGVEISTCRRSYARLERGGCTGKPIDSSKRHLFSPDFSHRLCFADMPTNEHSYLSTLPSRRRPKMSSTCPTVFWRSCSSSVIFIKMFFSATSLRNENKDEKELANKQANTGKKKKLQKSTGVLNHNNKRRDNTSKQSTLRTSSPQDPQQTKIDTATKKQCRGRRAGIVPGVEQNTAATKEGPIN